MTFKTFTSQFLDNLAPVAATLFASKKENKLAKIMIESNRLMGFISTMMFVPLIIFIKPLLKIWLELEDPDGITVGIILLISMYIIVFFRSTSVKILLMGDNYKKLSVVAIIECAANLGISIILIRYIGIIGVALGTLIPNFLLMIFFNIPIGLKFSGITLKEYFKQSVRHSLWIGMLTYGFAFGLRELFYPETFLRLFLLTILTSIFYLTLYYKFGTYGWERKQFREFVSSKFSRKNTLIK